MALDPTGSKSNLRDELISQARHGIINPQQAEAEAAAHGLEPFERKPPLSAFDPMKESRWSIVMAVAWIAWRDLEAVRENGSEFSSNCTHWIFRRWNQPVDGGSEFATRKGWFLETWLEPTTVRLMLLEKIRKAKDELPATACLTVGDAKNSLWAALSDGHLVAEAVSTAGQIIDIPQREWSYLKLFEDGKRDVLRYAALMTEPYSNVKLKRDDLLRLWPRVSDTHKPQTNTGKVETYMLRPMLRSESAGYVPLCAALQWILTNGGTFDLSIEDSALAWQSGVEKLLPLICSGEIELIGLPRGGALTERIPGHALAVIKVLAPFDFSMGDILLNAPSHIACTPFVDQEHWSRGFNDELYLRGQSDAAWTHLQVRKTDILGRWPKPTLIVRTESECYLWLLQHMTASPDVKLKSRDAYRAEAQRKFSRLGARQFHRAWDRAVAQSGAHNWSKAGRPSKKSKRRTD